MSPATLAIICVTLGFIAYHFITETSSLQRYFHQQWGGEEDGNATWIHFKRLTGVFFYGIVPLIVVLAQGIDFQDIGWKLEFSQETILWSLGLGSLVTLINFFAARTEDNLAMYPMVRAKKWTPSLFLTSGLTWAAYLIAYEFLFRSYLLFSCEAEMGMWLAITLNISFYVLLHIPKGLKETLGCIPLGLVLCLLTLKTGTIWIAVFVHVALGLTNEWFSIRYGRKAGMWG